ncbi:hypothetical protein CC1G_12296 [Coprinopsis cinerea okayama7|uniref:Uncharacterized protein n=1 Tax=Coprinopsis cinerea (strain Okayama-7 / 130 / ATCC MYA-4618 / FGSC 9003) TaxID=240176 RepID=A8NE25_COPC7|nr:hypothetical protein CC1G_12296 [Coprinopsis cinerea okayama7\|eukprot:XP_001832927.1 hypothetical protein CC1G_12296 [Coprinopsis cinerea okayama7\
MYRVINPAQLSSDSTLSGALGFATAGTQQSVRVPQGLFIFQQEQRRTESQAKDPIPAVTTVRGDGIPFKCLPRPLELPGAMIENPDGPAIENIDRVGNGLAYFHILWPGYEGKTYEFRCKQANGKSVTRRDFIKRVIVILDKFFATVQEEGEICTDPKWRIGEGGIKFTDLRLRKIMNVATNKHWQAEILVELRN